LEQRRAKEEDDHGRRWLVLGTQGRRTAKGSKDSQGKKKKKRERERERERRGARDAAN